MKDVAKTVSGWISPGCRGLDSFIGKVVGPEMRVSEKGDRNLGPKWKRPRRLGTRGTDCQISKLLTGRPGELQSGGYGTPAINDKNGSRLRALLSQSQMPALVSSEMVGGIAYWAVGPRTSQPGPDVDIDILRLVNNHI